jgi:hypothetical protein
MDLSCYLYTDYRLLHFSETGVVYWAQTVLAKILDTNFEPKLNVEPNFHLAETGLLYFKMFTLACKDLMENETCSEPLLTEFPPGVTSTTLQSNTTIYSHHFTLHDVLALDSFLNLEDVFEQSRLSAHAHAHAHAQA